MSDAEFDLWEADLQKAAMAAASRCRRFPMIGDSVYLRPDQMDVILARKPNFRLGVPYRWDGERYAIYRGYISEIQRFLVDDDQENRTELEMD
jgi:hypothetical protein